eukprot:gb/GECG01008123.1/.p1 GENE.gb/GECG01008123.1/~~gb/GECG01008123.1/.p1  ORF type:complete len:539 (+),score=45.72 gb/GECG01008123.1/:1-1617(+)
MAKTIVMKITWTNTEISLGCIGVAFGILFTWILWRFSRLGLVTLSHRFRFLIFLLGQVFVRGLCSFIGVGEAEYAQHDPNSILPFFLFDVADLILISSVLALVGAQVRNVVSCELLVEKRVVERTIHTARRPRQHSQTLLGGPRFDRFFPSGFQCRPESTEYVSFVVFLLVLGLSIAYTTMVGYIYHFVENGKKRHSDEQLFFIVVYAVSLVLLVISTYAEQASGCLRLCEHQDDSSNENHSLNTRPDAQPSEAPGDTGGNAAYKVGENNTTYGKKQLWFSILLIALLVFRIIWAVSQLVKKRANEFRNDWYWLVVEYAVEIFLLTLLFALLLCGKEKMVHGSYRKEDPYFILHLVYQFCDENSSEIDLSFDLEGSGVFVHYSVSVNQILRLMATTTSPVVCQMERTHQGTDRTSYGQPDTSLNRLESQFSQLVQRLEPQNTAYANGEHRQHESEQPELRDTINKIFEKLEWLTKQQRESRERVRGLKVTARQILNLTQSTFDKVDEQQHAVSPRCQTNFEFDTKRVDEQQHAVSLRR